MKEHLGRARDTLEQSGVLPEMIKIIRETYARNADRHEPVLGDDATIFGITTSRNIANLTVARLKGLPGAEARLSDSALEVLCGGYVLRQYKLPGSTRYVSVDSISWDDSEAKLDGAVENSSVGQLTLDADPEAGREAFGAVIPVMRHLRLAHAGDLETGECVIYLGFPRDNRDGGRPWIDVDLVDGDAGGPPGTADGTGSPNAPVPSAGPAYDELPLPDVGLGRRVMPRPQEGRPDAAE